MWCEAGLIAVGVLLMLWLVYSFIQWVVNDDIFFDGGYWPEHDEEDQEDDSRSN